MPRINISCHWEYFPPDRYGSACNDKQELVDRMAEALPRDVIARRDQLHLEEGTPEEAVQVCIRKFHFSDRNVPDVGIEFIFTEPPPPESERRAIAEALKDLFERYFEGWDIRRSLDIDWGPQHGYIAEGIGSQCKVTTW